MAQLLLKDAGMVMGGLAALFLNQEHHLQLLHGQKTAIFMFVCMSLMEAIFKNGAAILIAAGP